MPILNGEINRLNCPGIAGDVIRFVELYDQVVVVAHEGPCVDTPSPSCCHAIKQLCPSLAIEIVSDDSPTFQPPSDDVVNAVRDVQSQCS